MAAKSIKKIAAGKKGVQPKPKKKEFNMTREVLEVLIPAILLFLFIHFFIAEARFVPSQSMVPTIQIGDRFLIEKVSYYFHGPQRGDIVVFQPPQKVKDLARMKNQPLDDFIKRVVGLPGDTVQIKEGVVYINGKPLQEPYVQKENRTYEDIGSVKIPAGNYLVMGDNRKHSWDGRYWGFVPRKNVIGHAVWRFWPLNHISLLK